MRKYFTLKNIVRFGLLIYIAFGFYLLSQTRQWHFFSIDTLSVLLNAVVIYVMFKLIWYLISSLFTLKPQTITYIKTDGPLAIDQLLNAPVKTVYYYNKPDVQGVVSVINKRELEYNFTVKRNNSVRQNSNPRAWPHRNPFYYASAFKTRKNPHGKSYEYHRTHLVPFRYCLREDHNFTVTATSQVNNGNLPSKNYRVDNLNRYQNSVAQLVTKARGNTIINPRRIGWRTPYWARLSLDDFERYSTMVIKQNPAHVFVYEAQAVYTDEYQRPAYIHIRFADQTSKKLIFDVKLTND